jgi:uncharacterized damage-inducible protein DinB
MAIEQKDFTNNLFALLKEFFESPPTSGAACLDQKTGLFDTLASLSSARASRRMGDAPSIAAHCEHIRFYNDILIGGLQGKTYGKIDWKQSWLLQTVSDEAWKKLQDTLMQQYQAFIALLESFETWDDYKVGDPMAIVAHTAYHLGAIRQLLRFV